jgi:acyl-CoA synthetase (AMP-forming)/AMP-acid ligase II
LPYRNVAELLILNTNRYPQKTAILYKDRRITYKELNNRVNAIAHSFLQLGIGKGDKVGYLLPNCNELIEVYYAIQKIGAIAVPLNFRITPREIVYLVNNAKCRCLVFAAQFEPKVNAIKESLKTVEFFICSESSSNYKFNLKEAVSLGNSTEPSLVQDGEALSRIQYTGGTTGLPKGVMRTHNADLAEIIGVMASNGVGMNPDEVVLIQCPLEHHGGHSWFTSALAAGATLIICDNFNAEEILRLIQEEKVTYMLLLPPATYLRLLDCPALNKYDLSSVKLVQSSAGATSAEIIRRIYECFPNCRLNYGWGQTESGLGTSLVLTREMAEHGYSQLTSIGKPMPFIELRIVDEHDRTLGCGQAGECLTRGPAAMSGYYCQPELTQETITADGWIRTGDIMIQDEQGYYYLLSRKKDMIKSGGENVFSKEVEDVILKHPAVVGCLVFGIPHRRFGEAVMAVVQLKEGASLTLEELQEHCMAYIASYKKPLYADFVYSLPFDDAGKISKYKIAEMYKQKFLLDA